MEAHYADLTRGSYQRFSKANEIANQYGYQAVPDDSDLSKKRTYTLYEHPETKEAVLAFRGTSKRSLLRDLTDDAALAIGLKPKSLKQAEEVAKRAVEKYGENLVIAGHSLGGSKALYSGKNINKRSLTYNPYISPTIEDGLKDYVKTTKSEVHINIRDPIGASAYDVVPKSHLIAYDDANDPHSIKTFLKAKAIPLRKTVATNVAKIGRYAQSAVDGAVKSRLKRSSL